MVFEGGEIKMLNMYSTKQTYRDLEAQRSQKGTAAVKVAPTFMPTGMPVGEMYSLLLFNHS